MSNKKNQLLNNIYIATISGGKDSVAMTDLLLKNGYPVDYILFYDTFLEFPIMYKYLEKVKKYFN
ncbi:phosphoadenosine phosphosulfate reductase domain-containing protein [Aliarcobacter lanthieri]|uniref:phosphoadenosine phosphosulfate reductase domain-containing protein n=1 Tax=Aliarcobacter lanthieri TaxID=1355374 RepID=UPI000479E3DD|nr:phosphoadenosine phosphosulfate reductase family protein [Aliarcobacter lanthieri]